MTKFSEASLYAMTIRESATDGSDFSNAPTDYRRLFLGEDGSLHLKDSAGAVTDIGGGGGDVATDAIWDAKGDLAAATGANTAAKLTVGTNDHVLIAASGESTGLKWGQPSGTVIGRNVDTSGDHNTSGASLADADATNAKVTFTVPASGSVLVRLAATVATNTTASAFVEWGLRENTTNIAGPSIVLRNPSAPPNPLYASVYREYVITGLTPGTSKTYKWAHACSSGTGVLIAGSASPAIMTVEVL